MSIEAMCVSIEAMCVSIPPMDLSIAPMCVFIVTMHASISWLDLSIGRKCVSIAEKYVSIEPMCVFIPRAWPRDSPQGLLLRAAVDSPLTRDDSYVLIDSSDLSVDEVVERMARAIEGAG